MTMLSFDVDGNRFSVRVVAVVIEADHVLIHRAIDWDHWILPGGRAEFGESAQESLLREVREELEVDAEVDRLLWMVENFFELDGRQIHQLAFYFAVTLPTGSDYVYSSPTFRRVDGGVELEFRWVPLANLHQIRLLPSFLAHGLHELPETTVHIVHHDGKRLGRY